MKKIIFLFVLSALFVSLVACSSSSIKAGKYVLSAKEAHDVTISQGDQEWDNQYSGIDMAKSNYFELKKDHKAVMVIDDKNVISGTYKQSDDDEIIITSNGSTYELEYDEHTKSITYDYGNELEMIFTK